VLLAAALLITAAPAHAVLRERITTTSVTLPAALEPAVSSFHLWTMYTLGPRLYQAPRSDGRTLVGWTDAAMNGHVSILGTGIEKTFDFPAEPVRGLVAHDDGTFAVLLWNRNGTTDYTDDFTRLSKRRADGIQLWTVTVTTADYVPNPAAFEIGDSRLAYAGGVYGAYLSVHSSGGHEGDRYQRVSDTGAVLTGGWGWGLSHSMAGVIAPHPENGSLHTAGSSDCYPSKALLFDKNTVLFAADADCAGKVSVQLGQMAPAPGGAWLVAMDAIDRPGFPARGVGVVKIRPGGTPRLVWLTNTDGANERDPVIARIGTSIGANRYLVGWRSLADGLARVAVIDTNTTLISGVETLDAAVTWGARDDSYRTRPDGSVSWLAGTAGSRTLRLHRYSESPNVAVEPGASPSAPAAPLVMLAPAPNPAHGGPVMLRIGLARAAPIAVRILDGSGRRVRNLADRMGAAGINALSWDGFDDAGHPVPPGVYFAAAASGTSRASMRVLVLR
jgi:hypothetical protein